MKKNRIVKLGYEFARSLYYLFGKKIETVSATNDITALIKRVKSGSVDPERKYCIISPPSNIAYGTFEHWKLGAYKALYASSLGYIPVFDYLNYKSLLWKDEEASEKVNWWELFFKQWLQDVSLERVYKSKNVFLMENRRLSIGHRWVLRPPFQNELIKVYRELYQRIGAKEEVLKRISSFVVPPRTCAIPIRRNMEWGIRTKNPLYLSFASHHQRGRMDTYLKWIENGLKTNRFEQFFLAVEDEETRGLFIKEFGGKCLFFDRMLMRKFKNGKPLCGEEFIKSNEEYLSNRIERQRDYIAETHLLSRCDMLLANGNTSQAIMPLVIADKEIEVIHDPLILEMYEI